MQGCSKDSRQGFAGRERGAGMYGKTGQFVNGGSSPRMRDVQNLLKTQSPGYRPICPSIPSTIDFPPVLDQDGGRSSAVMRPWVAKHGTSGRARRTLRKRPTRMVGLFAFVS